MLTMFYDVVLISSVQWDKLSDKYSVPNLGAWFKQGALL